MIRSGRAESQVGYSMHIDNWRIWLACAFEVIEALYVYLLCAY